MIPLITFFSLKTNCFAGFVVRFLKKKNKNRDEGIGTTCPIAKYCICDRKFETNSCSKNDWL